MGGDLITSPAQRVGVIDRWCCQIPTHPQLVPQGGIVGQTIDRCITSKEEQGNAVFDVYYIVKVV